MSLYNYNYNQSPDSSNGVVGSVDGTPFTAITVFSPEDVKSAKSKNVHTSGAQQSPSQNDPFVSTGTQFRGRLSATASSFQPSFELRSTSVSAPTVDQGSAPAAQIPNPSEYLEKLVASQTPPRASIQSNATQYGTFTSDTRSSRYLKVIGGDGVDVYQLVKASKKRLYDRNMARRGLCREEMVGGVEYIRLANIKDAIELSNGIKLDYPDLIVEYIPAANFGRVTDGPRTPGNTFSDHEGQVLLTVTYPTKVHTDMKLLEESLVQMLEVQAPLCAWQKLSATPSGTFRMVAEYEDVSFALEAVSRGRKINENLKLKDVMVSVKLHRPDVPDHILAPQLNPTTPTRRSGEQSHLEATMASLSVKDPLTSTQSPSSNTPYLATAQGFAMPSSVPYVMGGLNGVYVPSVVSGFPQAYQSGILPQVNLGLGYAFAAPYQQSAYVQNGYGYTGAAFQPSFGNDFGYYDQRSAGNSRDDFGCSIQRSPGQFRDVGPFNRQISRRQYASTVRNTQGRHSSNQVSNHHNQVDVNRIRQGIDVRTTVMLRNIPNKVDQSMLKRIVDRSSFGRYDFMYLRIDFSNNCNVGYAFINFVDPLDIVDFVNARANQKWDMFRSDKVAEVSYATIQGKDCLVQKFRNSSVMLEPPHHRPKLFKTVHDPSGRAGEEEHFPESDNASKLKRSCENAEHVGLFAPNAGQHLRDEQRRRRSQYDRGTSLAEREEFVYDEPYYSSLGYYDF